MQSRVKFRGLFHAFRDLHFIWRFITHRAPAGDYCYFNDFHSVKNFSGSYILLVDSVRIIHIMIWCLSLSSLIWGWERVKLFLPLPKNVMISRFSLQRISVSPFSHGYFNLPSFQNLILFLCIFFQTPNWLEDWRILRYIIQVNVHPIQGMVNQQAW